VISNVDQLILGTNPMVGTSHFSGRVGRVRGVGLATRDIAELIDVALSHGATAINFSPTDLMYATLRLMKDSDYSKEFGVYLMLPDMEKFRRIIMTEGTSGVLTNLFAGMGWADRLKTVAQGAAALLKSDYTTLLDSYVRLEAKRLRSILPRNASLRCILAHEQLTDLASALDAHELVKAFIQHVPELGVQVGFVTRNLPLFVEFFRNNKIGLDRVPIMSPFNKVGFQMVPSRKACEDALSQIASSKVIAISLLAGGRLTLDDGVEYLKTLTQIRSAVVGTSDLNHARETFSGLGRILG
jgi:hypothetical protein